MFLSFFLAWKENEYQKLLKWEKFKAYNIKKFTAIVP